MLGAPLGRNAFLLLFLIKKKVSRLLELVEEERWGCLGLGAVFAFELLGHWNLPWVPPCSQRWTDRHKVGVADGRRELSFLWCPV